jgi:hypothetical protein
MPLLVAGLHQNTSLFLFHVADCAPLFVPEEMAKFAGGWIQDMERVVYRTRFPPLIRAPKERLPPRGIRPHALAWVAPLPDVILGCCVPNPAWCRLKIQTVRKQLKIPASQRNESLSLSLSGKSRLLHSEETHAVASAS